MARKGNVRYMRRVGPLRINKQIEDETELCASAEAVRAEVGNVPAKT
jgi:hypothetical protein